jgi:hypothetical protein
MEFLLQLIGSYRHAVGGHGFTLLTLEGNHSCAFGPRDAVHCRLGDGMRERVDPIAVRPQQAGDGHHPGCQVEFGVRVFHDGSSKIPVVVLWHGINSLRATGADGPEPTSNRANYLCKP